MAAPRGVESWLRGRTSDPSIRYRYLTEIEHRPLSHPRVRAARRQIGREGWAAQLLAQQFPDGHWATGSSVRDGPSGPINLYWPKYTSTNWVAIVLGDLGVTRSDPRVRKTAELILRAWAGRKAYLWANDPEICITGNAVRTLVRFGYLDHPDVTKSIEWLLGAQKRDGGWHCFPSRTGTLDGWEPLAAFSVIPRARRSAAVRSSIERGAEFYLERGLSREGPKRYAPWFRIHYPNHYYYDLLVGLSMLVRLGYAKDERLEPALDWLEKRRRADGAWSLDAAHPDLAPDAGYGVRRVHYPMILESPGQPSQWATIEALTVLRAAGRV